LIFFGFVLKSRPPGGCPDEKPGVTYQIARLKETPPFRLNPSERRKPVVRYTLPPGMTGF
jgi:hypothetical protein